MLLEVTYFYEAGSVSVLYRHISFYLKLEIRLITYNEFVKLGNGEIGEAALLMTEV